MNIFVLRHGEREDFVDESYSKRSSRPLDPPLSSQGYRQAKNVEEYFRKENVVFDEIFCSPYIRCIEIVLPTVKYFHYQLKVELSLSEYCFDHCHDTDSYHVKDLKEFFGGHIFDDSYQSFMNYNDFPKTRKEKLPFFRNRTKRFLDHLIDTYQNSKKNILLVTHAGTKVAINEFLTNQNSLTPEHCDIRSGVSSICRYDQVKKIEKEKNTSSSKKNYGKKKDDNNDYRYCCFKRILNGERSFLEKIQPNGERVKEYHWDFSKDNMEGYRD